MAEYLLTLKLPERCDCCSAALPTHEAELTRGTYQLSLPDGPVATEVRLGKAIRIVLGGERLVVELAELGGNAWELLPTFNQDAFSHPRRTKLESGGSRFTCDLLKFAPWYSSWWAELQFVEVNPFRRTASGDKQRAPNGATLSIRRLTL